MRPVLNLAGAFAAGALVTYFLARALSRDSGRPPRVQAHLRERVRARIADLVSRPEAVDVDVDAGVVRVSGYVLASELDSLLSRLTHLAGVHKVRNALTPLPDAAALEKAVGRPKSAALQA
jgi:hypothetical protein